MWDRMVSEIISVELIAELSKYNDECRPDRKKAEEYSRVTTLTLGGTGITALPEGIKYLTGLSKLSFSGTVLDTFPEQVLDMSGLTELDLSFTNIKTVPEDIKRLTKLKTLSLKGNRIETLPAGLFDCCALERLDLSNNNLKAVPGEICRLTSLKSLDISYNYLNSVCPEIGKLKNSLTSLNLSHNRLTAVLDEICFLTSLTELDLSNNSLKELPYAMGRLANIEALDLSHNSICELPVSLTCMVKLETLDLSSNRLKRMPSGLEKLEALQSLALEKNYIRKLSPKAKKPQKLDETYTEEICPRGGIHKLGYFLSDAFCKKGTAVFATLFFLLIWTVLDYYNVWSEHISVWLSSNFYPCLAIALFCFALAVFLLSSKKDKMLRSGTYIRMDFPLVYFECSLIVYMLSSYAYGLLCRSSGSRAVLEYGKFGPAVILGAGILYFIARLFFIKYGVRTVRLKEKNGYTLSDCMDRDGFTVDKTFHLVDCELDETENDIFDRKSFVASIADNIKSGFNHNSSFSIGLNGPYGSGKSSIVNMAVKRFRVTNDKYVIIDDIEPWLSGTPEILIKELYQKILDSLGTSNSSSEVKRNTKAILQLTQTVYSETVVSSLAAAGETLLGLINPESKSNDELLSARVKSLKEDLKKKIVRSGKRFIVLLDNFDRADKDNVLAVFRTVSCFFNLPDFVYIFLYDRENLERMFSDNPRFYEKIINVEYKIPYISDELQRQTYRTITENIIGNASHNADTEAFSSTISLICNHTTSIRDYIRIINSTVAGTFFTQNNGCYKPDLFAIQTICFLRPNIIQGILHNKNLLLSSDSDKASLFNDRNAFCERFSLNRDDDDYCDFLIDLFSTAGKNAADNRICFKESFDAYFQFSDTYQMKMAKSVNKLIEDVDFSSGETAILAAVQRIYLDSAYNDRKAEYMAVFRATMQNDALTDKIEKMLADYVPD